MATAQTSSIQWPSSRDYVEAIQNPSLCFQDPDLRLATPAVDRLGMPFVTSGQFAYVFKLNTNNGPSAEAVRCFRGAVGDREHRYRLINDHLNKVSAPYFASFEYDPEGILVTGKRYPLLVMEWIDGLPLDVYLPNILNRPDVLKFLSDLWLKILGSLRNGSMAHGDLQHGNIIVDTSNSVRLVDLDGMFVPSMAGWKSAELGHRHYQHPKRSPEDFDERLDNFSGLVIYLSLLALAEAPNLWTEYHDENLIFTKTDFDNPRSSPLFAKIKRISSAHRQLAEVLEKACTENPKSCPSVLDLVTSSPSKLPSWMLSSPTVNINQATREVKPGSQPQPPVTARPPINLGASASAAPSLSAWQPAQAAAPPQTGGGATSPTSSFSPPLATAPPTALLLPGLRHALNYAFVGVFFVWAWYPLLQALFIDMGATSGYAGRLAVMAFLAFSIALGYRRAKRNVQPITTPGASAQPPVSVSTLRQSPQPTWQTVPSPPVIRPSAPSQVAFVGSRIRLIYHRPHCRWASKISYRNRVQFASLAAAKAAGYKPCGTCSP